MHEKQLALRIIVYIIALFILSVGITFSINSNLGVSPITSLPYVISLITEIYVGRVVTMIFVLLILIQIILLRRDYNWINLTQIIFSTIFGYFVDFTMMLFRDFSLPTYLGQLLMLGISVVCISLGIILQRETNLVLLPPEGIVEAITKKIPNGKFHIIKMMLDCVFVALAIILALAFLGNFAGIREGTIIAAVFVGRIMPVIKKFLPFRLQV